MPLSKIQMELLYQLIQRDIISRNKGSLLGNAWAILTSAGTLAMYTFVFTKIFSAKWPQGDNANSLVYALNIYAGLIVFNFVSDMLSRSPTLVTDHSNLIQKVIFPSEILPLVALGTAFYFYLINCAILIIASSIISESWSPHVILAPFMILPVAATTLGLTYAISSLSVFVKDIRQIVAIALPLLMFLSPVFYSSNMMQGVFRTFLMANPLSSAIEASRALYFQSGTPDFRPLVWHSLIGFMIIAVGWWIFSRLKKGFADAL